MKILYLISTVNSEKEGIGGHYYSLLTTAEALSGIHNVRIIHIGHSKSIAFKNAALKVDEINSPSFNIYNLYKALISNIKENKPDVIHSFDIPSYFFARIISEAYKIPNILTKCGGENPKIYFPFAHDLILFSKENETYFTNANKFRKTEIHLIPNRVKK
jgi:hypothetical protein